ncbi:hypothetical protein BKA65DRAFT_101181 [Rhexocercosporidium sp. MPI-PUGE-AT-0058]|nr:hypothetical protein BKA65DRAFT_101181 [Rhexocercosporidium sp. MPI-PUGE-AT-0058]
MKVLLHIDKVTQVFLVAMASALSHGPQKHHAAQSYRLRITTNLVKSLLHPSMVATNYVYHCSDNNLKCTNITMDKLEERQSNLHPSLRICVTISTCNKTKSIFSLGVVPAAFSDEMQQNK